MTRPETLSPHVWSHREAEAPLRWRAGTRGLEVEGAEVRLEVDVQPFASGGGCFGGRTTDERRSHAAMPVVRIDDHVEQECVHATVPGDVDEPEEAIGVAERANPRQALAGQPTTPRLRRGERSAECSSVQAGELAVIDLGSHRQSDVHGDQCARDEDDPRRSQHTEMERMGGEVWRHFRGLDGNIYEITGPGRGR